MKPVAISAALTWDGTSFPVRNLPMAARVFLNAGKTSLPSAKTVGKLFSDDSVTEIRICWVPELRGGKALSDSFATSNGKRLPFRAAQSKRFGDILGVVYRK